MVVEDKNIENIPCPVVKQGILSAELLERMDAYIYARVDAIIDLKCKDCEARMKITTRHENLILFFLTIISFLLLGFCAFLFYYSYFWQKTIAPEIWTIVKYSFAIIGIAWVLGILKVKPRDVYNTFARGASYFRNGGNGK